MELKRRGGKDGRGSTQMLPLTSQCLERPSAQALGTPAGGALSPNTDTYPKLKLLWGKKHLK